MSNNFADVPKGALPIIYALSAPELTPQERDFFKEANPVGFILFNKDGARNIEAPDQVKALNDSLRELVGWNCPILIDQEGGRVQRMNSPRWRKYPPANDFGEKALEDMNGALEALRFNSLQMAQDLIDCGINVNCTPVLDVLAPETHDIIGDRSFGSDPEIVSRLGLSVCRHYLSASVTPIIKHIPGHGRAAADSHLELPVVEASKDELAAKDFKPFADIAASDVGAHVWAMTAHVKYDALDKELPATISHEIINGVIRKQMGFEGIIVSDDLDMKALLPYGEPPEMAVKALDAGCDLLLHCTGEMQMMQKIAEKLPKISDSALKRLQNSAGLGKKVA